MRPGMSSRKAAIRWIFAAGLLSAMLVRAVPAPALAASATLRYHFVNGQVLTYKLSLSTTLTVDQEGLPAVQDSIIDIYLVHYRFTKVTASGSAMLAMIIDHHTTYTFNTSGKQTSSVSQPPATTYWLQEPDGRQYTLDRTNQGAYSNGNLGLVSEKPVAVGGSWVAAVDNGVGIKGQKLPCTNVLHSLAHATGGPTATVYTLCMTSGATSFTQHGKRFDLYVEQSITGHWQFAVKRGRFIGQEISGLSDGDGTVTDAHGIRNYRFKDTYYGGMSLVDVSG